MCSRRQPKQSTGASIATAAANVFATDDHVITCSLIDIPAQIAVIWDPYTTTVADFKKDDGTHSGTSQIATLTISAAKLLALHGAGSASVDFKCKIQVGTTPTDVTATQTVSIYSPSEKIIFSDDRFCDDLYVEEFN